MVYLNILDSFLVGFIPLLLSSFSGSPIPSPSEDKFEDVSSPGDDALRFEREFMLTDLCLRLRRGCCWFIFCTVENGLFAVFFRC